MTAETAAPRSVTGSDHDVVTVDGRRWRRIVVRTRWLTEHDDLGEVLDDAVRSALGGRPRRCDVVAIAEKIAIVTSGRAVPITAVAPGRLARILARSVRPVGYSRGLAVPEKMQYVLDHRGRGRVLTAAAAAAVTRPLGLRGMFYRLAGALARDLDGARDGYEDRLLPPLTAGEAGVLCHHLAVRIGATVAVVDINDRGGSVRSVSAGGPTDGELRRLLADNPHGDGEQSTPVVLLRPLD